MILCHNKVMVHFRIQHIFASQLWLLDDLFHIKHPWGDTVQNTKSAELSFLGLP